MQNLNGHIETVYTLLLLGVVYKNLGKFNKAKYFYETAIKIQERHYGKYHIETANSLAFLGNVYKNLGNL